MSTEVEKFLNAKRHIVITVATHEEGYFSYFKQSCERHGVEPVIIGAGVTWKNYGTKLHLIGDWVLKNANDDDCILIVDCYDVIFFRPLEPMFEQFRKSACKARNGPHKYIYVANEPHSSLYKSTIATFYDLYDNELINSGSLIASGKLIKSIYNDPVIAQDIENQKLADDQRMIISYLNRHSDVVCKIDHNRRFIVYAPFMHLDVGARLDIDESTGEAFYKHDNQTYRPYLLHRPAGGSMRTILKKLGYNTDNVQIKSGVIPRFFTYHVPGAIDAWVVKPIVSVMSKQKVI